MSLFDFEISQDYYVLDSNYFMQAYRLYYDMKLFPCFWEWTRKSIVDGSFILIDKVYDEFTETDELFNWVHNYLGNYVTRTNLPEIEKSYKEVLQCATSFQPKPNCYFEQNAIEEFSNVADSWLIAYAKTRGGHVVTNEQPGHTSVKVIKIPTICTKLNIEFLTREDLLKQLHPVFSCQS